MLHTGHASLTSPAGRCSVVFCFLVLVDAMRVMVPGRAATHRIARGVKEAPDAGRGRQQAVHSTGGCEVPAGRQAGGHAGRQAGQQAGRKAGRETGRQARMQTGRQAGLGWLRKKLGVCTLSPPNGRQIACQPSYNCCCNCRQRAANRTGSRLCDSAIDQTQ